MGKSVPRRLVLTCALMLLAPFGIGQDAIEERLADPGQGQQAKKTRKAGYHTEGFRFRPSVSAGVTYVDNIFATDNNTISDWVALLSPQLRVDSTWARHSLQFKAGADVARYWEFDAENYNDYWGSAEGRFDLNETTELFGGIGFSFEHEGRDSPDATLGGQEPTTYRSLNAHAGIKTVVADTTFRLGATFENLDFNDVSTGAGLLINDDRDRDMIGLGIRATHPLNEKNDIFAQAVYDVRDYDRSTDQDGFDRDSDGYRVAVGIKSDLGGGNNAEAYVGVLHQSYEDSRFDAISKADFGGRITLAPGKDTKVTARLQRSLNETTVNASPGYVSTAFNGKIEHRVTPRLIPEFSVSYELADYLQSGREDDVYSAQAGVKYFVARNAYIIGGVRHTARESNDKDRLTGSNDFDKNSIFLTFVTQGYPLSEPMISDFETDAEVAVGLLSVSDDTARFGRYNGLDEEGIYWNSDLSLRSEDGDKGYARIKGLNLGLDSRSLDIVWGSQGDYEAYVSFDQIPFRDFNGKTIFVGVGGTDLTRPAVWNTGDETGDFQDLASSLVDVEIGTKRKRFEVGTLLHANKDDWTFSIDYRTESKEGLTQLAGTAGIAPGNARSAMLPAPVDYTTNIFEAALGYQRDMTSLAVSYEGSFFYNNLGSLRWESPFAGIGPRGEDNRMSLPPDNQFHRLMVSGGRSLTPTTHLTGVASVGLMLQDEDFLSDHVDPTKPPNALPRSSLDGEVYLYNALLALSSRPMRGLNLKASYRLNKRDNQTEQDAFTYFVNDTTADPAINPDVIATATNQPYSYDKRTMKLEGNYRFNRMARLGGEVARETVKRSPSEVNKTTENKGKLKLRLKPLDDLQVSIKGGLASRDGSDYQTIPGENPLLRKYNIADRDRVSYGIDVSYQPTERLSLTAGFNAADDDYDDTRVGLTDAKQKTLTLDASYLVSEELSTYAYLGRDVYKSRQAGSQVPNTPDWFIQNDDIVDSLGAGLRWQKDRRLEVGVDYTLSSSTGETRMQSDNAQPPLSQFPDIKSNLHSLRLYADYRLKKNTTLKLTYQYEKLDADEWAIDGVNVDTIPEVLLLGEENPSYEQHVVGLALAVAF